MAKATIDTVTKTVTEQVDEDVIVLTLSKVEARALYALTRWVFGPRGTYADPIRSISNALNGTNKLGIVGRHLFFRVDEDNDLEGRPLIAEDK